MELAIFALITLFALLVAPVLSRAFSAIAGLFFNK